MERVTASVSEFARIVGVDRKAVSRAIERGGRLEKSIVKKDGKVRIAICDGCLEWVVNKDHRRDHIRKASASEPLVSGIMSRDASTEMDRHYSALMKQLEYGKACLELVPVAKYAQHASECLSACRDTLANLPLILSELSRPIILRFVQDDDEPITPALQKRMDDAVLQFRVAAKREVRKALNQAADMIEGQIERDREKARMDESLNAL